MGEILEKYVKEIAHIAPLSQVSMQLMEMLGSGKKSIEDTLRLEDVVRLVEIDPGLTANVLRVVNSPAYRSDWPVSSLSGAVSLLGYRMIVGIAIATCSPRVYNDSLVGYEAGRGMLWQHCLRAAVACRELAARAKVEVSPEIAFTAGILHDIGKAVISEFLKGKAPEMLERVLNQETGSFLEAEREMVGNDHCEVGDALAEHWGLPKPIRQAIRHHHDPQRADREHQALVYVVHLGDAVSMMYGMGTGADTLQYPLDEGYTRYLAIDERTLDEIVIKSTEEFERLRTPLFNGD